MSAAGDAVLAKARTQIGVTESPPGSNNVPYWDWWGASLGSWCAVFASWCNWEGGYPLCAVDGPKGFVLVSNGTLHSYPEGEALPTSALYPGCTVLFSWYPWAFINGVPTIVGDPTWDGYIAGDHTGIFAYWIDQGTGQFACVEGNTSGSSWDNGGEVWERTDRFTSQVCGWWEPPSFGSDVIEPPGEEMTDGDFARIQQIVHDEVVNVWRAQEMYNLDKERAQAGSHEAVLGVVRSDEYAQIIRNASS